MNMRPYRFPSPAIYPTIKTSSGLTPPMTTPAPAMGGFSREFAKGEPMPPPPPKIPQPTYEEMPIPKGQWQDTAQKTQPLSVSPFMTSIYGSMQNIDPELRAGYLQEQGAKIKERLDRYEFRLARGIPLTPEQQQQYNSLKSSFNDIQNYINNPKVYDDYFAAEYEKTHRVPNVRTYVRQPYPPGTRGQ